MLERIKTQVKENEKLKNILALILIGSIGIIIFILIYGIDKINVTNENWLLNGEDLSQHYIGWKFFRNSEWEFPIGLMNNINYPYSVSIIFTDSIPILAIIFKMFSKILPETFQYFGIYGMLTFMLQGIFSYLLIYKFTKNRKYSIITSIFFIISPVIIQREFTHTALASHYIIVMALCLWAYNDKLKEKKILKNTLWIALAVFSTGIHLYFVPMVMLIMFATFCMDFAKKENIKENILVFITACILVVLEIYLLGGFTTGASVNYEEDGVGEYNSNLNTFFNSMEIENSLLRELPTFWGQYEGFGYLGAGILLLVILLMYNFLKGEKSVIKNQYIISGIAICFVSILVSTSLNFTINQHTILRIHLPEIMEKLIAIFRSTGRFIWMADYLIMTISIVSLYKNWNNKKAQLYLFAIVILLVQLYDIRSYIRERQTKVNIENQINCEIDVSQYKKMVFLPAENIKESFKKVYKYANLAVDNDMTINTYYMARSYKETVDYSDKIIEELKNGEIDDDTIYIFIDRELGEEINEKTEKLTFYEIDDTMVARIEK